MRILFPFLLFLFTNFSFAQNKDIEWLREINIERNQKLDPTFHLLDHSLFPVIAGAPLSVLGIGVLKKDSALTRKGLFMIGTFCVNSALTLGLKFTIDRPRPFVTYPEIEKLAKTGNGRSFPSGHTSGAFAAATSLSIAFPKWYVIVPSYIWASGVGYSRMHEGVHYPSDVFAGVLVGTGSAFLCHWVNKKLHWERKKNWFL